MLSGSVEDVLKCWSKKTILINGEWRPVVEVVDQSEAVSSEASHWIIHGGLM